MTITKPLPLLICFCTYLLVPSPMFSQFLNYNTENEQWFPGTVQMTDNQLVEGDLNYNFVSQVLRLRQLERIETINASEVLYFEWHEETGNKETFYSLPFKDETYNRERPVFFRVIHQTGALAILSRLVLTYKEQNLLPYDPNAGLAPNSARSKIERVQEVIYLGDVSGLIIPHLAGTKNIALSFGFNATNNYKLRHNDKSLKNSSSDNEIKRYKVIDKKTLSKFTGDEFSNVKSFIKTNKVKTNTIEGLIKIIDHYSKIKDR